MTLPAFFSIFVFSIGLTVPVTPTIDNDRQLVSQTKFVSPPALQQIENIQEMETRVKRLRNATKNLNEGLMPRLADQVLQKIHELEESIQTQKLLTANDKQAIKKQIEKLQARLDEMNTRFGRKHPQIVQIKSQIRFWMAKIGEKYEEDGPSEIEQLRASLNKLREENEVLRLQMERLRAGQMERSTENSAAEDANEKDDSSQGDSVDPPQPDDSPDSIESGQDKKNDGTTESDKSA